MNMVSITGEIKTGIMQEYPMPGNGAVYCSMSGVTQILDGADAAAFVSFGVRPVDVLNTAMNDISDAMRERAAELARDMPGVTLYLVPFRVVSLFAVGVACAYASNRFWKEFSCRFDYLDINENLAAVVTACYGRVWFAARESMERWPDDFLCRLPLNVLGDHELIALCRPAGGNRDVYADALRHDHVLFKANFVEWEKICI